MCEVVMKIIFTGKKYGLMTNSCISSQVVCGMLVYQFLNAFSKDNWRRLSQIGSGIEEKPITRLGIENTL